MFTSARIKITAWYLLIIMTISLAFSLFIYRVLSQEIYRFARTQRFRIEGRFFIANISPPSPDIELIEETKNRLVMTLVVINGTILAISGTLSYFLAGHTLRPIQQMVEEQNRFISDSSHELRTPLTALKSSLEVNLRDKKLSLSQARKLMAENIKEVDELQSLSDGLLTLTRYNSSPTPPEFKKVHLADIVAQAVTKVDSLLLKNEIILKNQVNDVTFTGNRQSLIDLVVILLDNAIKYSPAGSTISLSSNAKGKTVSFSIKDQGMGITAKDIPLIFNRFFRSDVSRSKTEIGGFGLGLSIAKKIVDTHHGHISVISSLNKGSTFTVSLQV
ncbi:hypothetical protein HYV64_01010 [Candidatus Shapirobacteria bacterium]|nr:hypothetical protein [Candidatus Shapirobacteria bacterium]